MWRGSTVSWAANALRASTRALRPLTPKASPRCGPLGVLSLTVVCPVCGLGVESEVWLPVGRNLGSGSLWDHRILPPPCRPRRREMLRALAAAGVRDLFHGSPESAALGEASVATHLWAFQKDVDSSVAGNSQEERESAVSLGSSSTRAGPSG